MADISQIAISGRVANEPTLKYTNSGTAVLPFSLACNRWNMGKTLTSFYDCTLWGKFAEAKDKILQKGMHVVASGTIDIVEFEGRLQFDAEGRPRGMSTARATSKQFTMLMDSLRMIADEFGYEWRED